MIHLQVPARLDQLDTIMEFIEAEIGRLGLDGRSKNSIMLAAEEIFVNIASYAYPSGEGEIGLDFAADGERIMLEFQDSGQPYDPTVSPEPDISLPASEREIGGLGLLLVRKLMDDMRYRYEDGKNLLYIEKRRER